MRTAYHEQLLAHIGQLGEMCALASVAMERATQALLRADLILAEQVITDHEHIAIISAHAQQTVFRLLALQAPVAGELRAIVSSLQTIADLERMSALALHVAKIARRRHPNSALPEQVNDYFAKMGALAVNLSNRAEHALRSGDPLLAARIDDDDSAIDYLHRQLFTMLTDHEWTHGATAAVDVSLLSRFYERFADHAVEVAHHVIFQTTGKRPAPV
jgi:phosphate transport system protein